MIQETGVGVVLAGREYKMETPLNRHCLMASLTMVCASSRMRCR